MPKRIDEKKTRKALRRLARARKAAEASDDDTRKLSEWEDEFLGSVEERLDEFGSAFNDPEKGGQDEALSIRQAVKLREIEKKTKGKTRKPMSRGNGFKRKTPASNSRSRDIHDDLEPDMDTDTSSSEASPAPSEAPQRPSGFSPRVIEGGKSRP